ncbi:hypothetical protein H0O71_24010, partial [Escherichia coli]|nr:hypothetical protein [Escherichia coli]
TLRTALTEANVYALKIAGKNPYWLRQKPEVLNTMFNQKLQTAEDIEFEIAEELRYETDPCELKLDEM